MTTTQAVARKEVELSHGKTPYLEAGTGHPVVLIHGVAVGGGSDDWRPVIEQLAQHYRVLAPYSLGWPPGDTYPTMDAFPYLTDHVREFQDALGLKSSHIIGATMGGWIAGLFAYESPNRVDKLIMTGNPGFHGAANDRLANFEVPEEDRVRAGIDRVGVGLSDAEKDAIVKEKMAKLNDPSFAEAFGKMMKTMADHGNRQRFNLIRRLPHLTMPTLFIIGKGDPSSEHLDKLKSVTPNSKVVLIEDGAHQVHYENTDQFCKAVIEFLG
jgi:pimeloyl-ACP methyl ester carboxylesterase